MSRWTQLIVEQGERARATGWVLRAGEKFVLVADDGVVMVDHGGRVSPSPCVPLQAAAFDESTLSQYADMSVEVQGRCTGTSLELEDLSHIRHRTTAVRPTVQSSPLAKAAKQRRATERPSVEQMLFADGILLDSWRSGDGHYNVLTTDVERSRSELTPFYSESLTIVLNRWPLELITDIESVFVDSTVPTVQIGRGRGADQQLKLVVTVLHVSRLLALRLDHVPDDLLDMRVLMEPIGARGSRMMRESG